MNRTSFFQNRHGDRTEPPILLVLKHESVAARGSSAPRVNSGKKRINWERIKAKRIKQMRENSQKGAEVSSAARALPPPCSSALFSCSDDSGSSTQLLSARPRGAVLVHDQSALIQETALLKSLSSMFFSSKLISRYLQPTFLVLSFVVNLVALLRLLPVVCLDFMFFL